MVFSSVSQRRDALCSLLTLSLTKAEIAALLGVSAEVVRRDCRLLNREHRLPPSADMSYEGRALCCAKLLSYASMSTPPLVWKSPRMDYADIPFFDLHHAALPVLEAGIAMDDVQRLCDAMMVGIVMMTRPKLPKKLWRTQRLLEAIREEEPRNFSINARDMFRKWHQAEGTFSSIDGPMSLAEQIVAFAQFGAFVWHGEYVVGGDVLTFNGSRIPVVITETTQLALDYFMENSLRPPERIVLSHYFPRVETSCVFPSDEMVAEAMKLPVPRVKQLRTSALERLRTWLKTRHDISPVFLWDTDILKLRNVPASSRHPWKY